MNLAAFNLCVSQWLEHEYRLDPRNLGVHRLCLAYLLSRSLSEVPWIHRLSDHLYYPAPGLMQLFPGFPSPEVHSAMIWVGTIALALLVLGVRAPWAAVVFSIIAVVLDGFKFSVEKVHHHVLILLTPLFLALTPWSTKFSLWPAKPNQKERYWPFAFLALFIGAIFFSSAVLKLGGGWLDLDTQAARAHLVAREISGFNRGLLSKQATTLGTDALWEVADWVTILFEGAVVFCVVRLRYFRLALAMAAVFHVGMYLAISANFFDYLAVYAVFFDWRGAVDKLRNGSQTSRSLLIAATVAVATLAVWSLHTGGLRIMVLYCGAALGVIYLAYQGSMWLSEKFGRVQT